MPKLWSIGFVLQRKHHSANQALENFPEDLQTQVGPLWVLATKKGPLMSALRLAYDAVIADAENINAIGAAADACEKSCGHNLGEINDFCFWKCMIFLNVVAPRRPLRSLRYFEGRKLRKIARTSTGALIDVALLPKSSIPQFSFSFCLEAVRTLPGDVAGIWP